MYIFLKHFERGGRNEINAEYKNWYQYHNVATRNAKPQLFYILLNLLKYLLYIIYITYIIFI